MAPGNGNGTNIWKIGGLISAALSLLGLSFAAGGAWVRIGVLETHATDKTIHEGPDEKRERIEHVVGEKLAPLEVELREIKAAVERVERKVDER
jgi:hypothetical protein